MYPNIERTELTSRIHEHHFYIRFCSLEWDNSNSLMLLTWKNRDLN